MSWDQISQEVQSIHRCELGEYELIVSVEQRSIVNINVRWSVQLDGSTLVEESMPNLCDPSKIEPTIDAAKAAAQRYVESRKLVDSETGKQEGS